MASNKRPLKLYMRYDGFGKLISGSAVWRKNSPKNGNWVEITQAYECCGTTTTTTTSRGDETTTTTTTTPT